MVQGMSQRLQNFFIGKNAYRPRHRSIGTLSVLMAWNICCYYFSASSDPWNRRENERDFHGNPLNFQSLSLERSIEMPDAMIPSSSLGAGRTDFCHDPYPFVAGATAWCHDYSYLVMRSNELILETRLFIRQYYVVLKFSSRSSFTCSRLLEFKRQKKSRPLIRKGSCNLYT